MKKKLLFMVALIIAVGACKSTTAVVETYSNGAKGHLFIIGGGHRSSALMDRFIALAGGPQAKVLIVPFATSAAEETGIEHVEEFAAMGCEATYVSFKKGEADLEENLKKLDGITGVYFSGGDQVLLADMILGTKFLEKIKEVYYQGGVVGGTSAGAAVMSRIMITGNELVSGDKALSFACIKKGNVEISEGFGFIDFAIIDQHFIQRKRENRLINLVIENKLPGIGIDESTAIIMGDGRSFEVFGDRSVMVFEPHSSEPLRTDAEGNLAGEQIKLTILLSGDHYTL
jgi:cyanophycinase